jgi:pimeloyl-ACP methyl ester carboxylesterase
MNDARTEYRSLWTWLREVEFCQRWVDVNGVDTRIAEAGSKDSPAVILLHGTGGHREVYAPTIGPLSADFHCIAVDMVGNAFSDRPDYDYEIAVYVSHLAGLLDVLGIEQASFIGMSLGAWVAARFALDHPDRTRKLILQDPKARERNLLAPEQWAAIQAPTLVVASGKDHSEYLTTPRLEGRGFRDSRPGVPVSRPTAEGVSLAVLHQLHRHGHRFRCLRQDLPPGCS